MEYLVFENGILSSKQGIRQFLKLYQESGNIVRKPGSGLWDGGDGEERELRKGAERR